MLYTKANIYSLCKSLDQVSLYLITAPRNTGGISHVFIRLKLGEQNSEEEEWNISLMHYLNRLDIGWARNDRVARRHIMVKDWVIDVEPCLFLIVYFELAMLRSFFFKMHFQQPCLFHHQLKALISNLYKLLGFFYYWMSSSHQGDKCEQPLFKTWINSCGH